MKLRRTLWSVGFIVLAIGGATACSSVELSADAIEELPTPTTISQVAPPPSTATLPAITPSATPTSISSYLPRPVSSATITPSPDWQMCSPLEGYTLAEIPALVSNPFRPPRLGSDDPHQGVDLADRLPGSQVAIGGRSVLSVLPGWVAGVIQERFPYGNAILIEVPLGGDPSIALSALALPTPLATPLTNPVLTCPQVEPPYPVVSQRSIYILYAHLADPPGLSLGQPVQCGEALGTIGQSGNALHPHLHLEVRVGPAQARFSSLAHYDNRASMEEMGLYCLWRVSGIFQLIDPLQFLQLGSAINASR